MSDEILATVKISIDDFNLEVPFGTTILEATRMVGIDIPTLCYHEDLCISGVCRICVVEVEGMPLLQASCAYPIHQPIKVLTHTRKVRQARRHVVDLMLADHVGECYSCVSKRTCELRQLADDYGVEHYPFDHDNKPIHGTDDSSYSIVRDMDKCIMCRRCIRTCVDLQEVGVYEAYGKGADTYIGIFGDKPMGEVVCINCGQCVNRCPTGALHAKDPRAMIWDAIDDPQKHVVIQTAPAPRSAIGECFGQEPGKALTLELNTALRECGFDKVFDTNFSADLTIMEEGSELIGRLYKALVKKEPVALPQYTSCSPGWVKYLEHFYPDMIPNLSSAKSPQQMFGSVIKTYYAEKHNIDPRNVVSVALMPCSAKKFECNRPEMKDSGLKDVDFGLTTREMAQMIKEAGIDLPKMNQSGYDDPFGDCATGSGVIFGASGGVMESAIRTLFDLVTGSKIENLFDGANIIPVRGFKEVKYAELTIDTVGPVPDMLKHLVPDFEWLKGVTLKVAVTHGTANAKKVLDDIAAGGTFSQCHFIEFMACPGGCLGGGGMPKPTSATIRAARAEAIYREDTSSTIRKSYENPAVIELYSKFLPGGPCSSKSHKLLHTHYENRGKKMV
ncbi:MAG: [FeFe] hydrogenase, group A [Fibrobacterales bacterium]